MDPIKIHTIVLHKQPHWDEAVGNLLLRLSGEKFFPGVKAAKVIFWNAGGNTPDGRSAEEWEAEGYLLVGVGGGRFDEHPSRNADRKQRECAATLIAKYLGIANDPALKTLLAYTYRTDSSMVTLPGADRDLVTFGVANISKLINRAINDDEQALRWMMLAALAQYKEQKAFWDAKKDLDKAEVREVKLKSFREPIKITAATSDNTSLNRLARSKEGNQTAVLIQNNSKGQVSIFTNTTAYKGLRLYDAVRLVRFAEILAKKTPLPLPSWNDLAKEQAPVGAEEWFFMHKGQMVLNGSTTNPDAKPTALPLNLIVDLVEQGLKLSDAHPCGAVCNCQTVGGLSTNLRPETFGAI